MRFLINCTFNYYVKHYLRSMPQYALIVKVDMYNKDEPLEEYVYEALKKLNFHLPKKHHDEHYSLTFTAQPI